MTTKIPLNGDCPKCGHNAGYDLRWCVGVPAAAILTRGRHDRGVVAGCEREGEHVHRFCKTCFYDSPVDPVDLAEKLVGPPPGTPLTDPLAGMTLLAAARAGRL